MDAPAAPARMSREEYRRWSEGQPGRYELVRGEVIKISAERAVHARIKAQLWFIFRREIRARGLAYEALPDGMTVEVGADTDYEPDVTINSGPRLARDDIAAPTPVVVVEVLSPGSRRIDTATKFADYFLVPSIRHYLIIRPDPDQVIHHQRGENGVILSRVVNEGTIRLDPPGIDGDVAEIFADA
jgi:Uma2 family endonuclease